MEHWDCEACLCSCVACVRLHHTYNNIHNQYTCGIQFAGAESGHARLGFTGASLCVYAPVYLCMCDELMCEYVCLFMFTGGHMCACTCIPVCVYECVSVYMHS